MSTATKVCARCKIEKPVSEFRIDRRRKNRLYAYCRACAVEYMREHRAKDPAATKELNRRNNIKRYGISPEEYEAMIVAQDGRCAICGGTEPRRNHGRFAIDHDHETCVIRGLLCGDCNNGLGLFADDVDRLAAAIEYLNQHRTTTPKEK